MKVSVVKMVKGDGGGQIVATGTPEEVIRVNDSYTGKYLKEVLVPDHYA